MSTFHAMLKKIFIIAYVVCILAHCHLLVQTRINNRPDMAWWEGTGTQILKGGASKICGHY